MSRATMSPALWHAVAMTHGKHVEEDSGWTASVAYAEDPLGNGTVIVETCDKCGYQVLTCQHSANAWNQDGTVLTCRLCGTEGT
jgi:hypothetical protein